METQDTAVKNGASATQEEGESPTTFEKQALEIINSLGGETPKVEDKKEETPKESNKQEEVGQKNELKEDKNKEENKVPYSRLQKVIEQRNEAREKISSLNEEIEILKKKLQEEQDRIASLSDEEKEEHSAFKKIGIETKEDRLKEKIETLEKKLADYEKKVKSYEEIERQERISKLSARIDELTKEYDGSNGLPKFDIEELIEFGKQENYMPDDPLKLYNLKYQNEIIARRYKAERTNSEADKGNREQFAPMTKKVTFDDPEFEKEALRIINSIT